jgi:OFA family oxalate/formate antiporter-like MFS transporter
MTARALPTLLIRRLPIFYGWVVLFCACCAGFARQGGAVATLSIFVEPMTREFGWSRAALSGAVSLGGVLAALSSPTLGRVLDRQGARLILCLSVLGTGAAAMLLSLTTALPWFYAMFCIARMNFAGPFDLGIYGAVNNWFVAKRTAAISIASVAQMSGLVVLPLIAQAAMLTGGWRAGWLAVGAAVLVVGFIPNWLLMVRRPEDVGLLPDGHAGCRAGAKTSKQAAAALPEPAFTRAEALRTPAFWLLALFTLFAYPVQAGVSLHQAPFLIERGLSPTMAATVVSFFSLLSGVSSLAYGFWPRRWPIRHALALTGALLAAGACAMIAIAAPWQAYLAAAIFGTGIGGLFTLLPIAWADYFGRRSFGAIRGIALTVQVLAQASGPLLSGVLRDATGSYDLSLQCFAVLSGAALLAALFGRKPGAPADGHTRAPAT